MRHLIVSSSPSLPGSLAAKFFAHAVVVVEHGLVAGQVELRVVHGVLSKGNGLVFVDDAADLDNLAHREANIVPVAHHFHVVVYVTQRGGVKVRELFL